MISCMESSTTSNISVQPFNPVSTEILLKEAETKEIAYWTIAYNIQDSTYAESIKSQLEKANPCNKFGKLLSSSDFRFALDEIKEESTLGNPKYYALRLYAYTLDNKSDERNSIIHILDDASKKGIHEAQLQLAILLLGEENPRIYEDKILSLLEAVASPVSHFFTGIYHEICFKAGDNKHFQFALDAYEKACKAGFTLAYAKLATLSLCLLKNPNDDELKKIEQLYTIGANKGDISALPELASLISHYRIILYPNDATHALKKELKCRLKSATLHTSNADDVLADFILKNKDLLDYQNKHVREALNHLAKSTSTHHVTVNYQIMAKAEIDPGAFLIYSLNKFFPGYERNNIFFLNSANIASPRKTQLDLNYKTDNPDLALCIQMRKTFFHPETSKLIQDSIIESFQKWIEQGIEFAKIQFVLLQITKLLHATSKASSTTIKNSLLITTPETNCCLGYLFLKEFENKQGPKEDESNKMQALHYLTESEKSGCIAAKGLMSVWLKEAVQLKSNSKLTEQEISTAIQNQERYFAESIKNGCYFLCTTYANFLEENQKILYPDDPTEALLIALKTLHIGIDVGIQSAFDYLGSFIKANKKHLPSNNADVVHANEMLKKAKASINSPRGGASPRTKQGCIVS